MSLVKAIGINLVEEQLRRKNESKNPGGKNEKRPKQPKPRGRDEERRGRSRTSRSGPNPSPLSRHGERSGSENPETPRPGTPAESDGDHDPPMDPAIEAEYRQAEEMEAERAQEARDIEEGHLASLYHSEERNPVHQENPFHDGHEADGPIDSAVSSMPPSSVSEPEGHPPGSRHSSYPPSVAGSTYRHAATVSPTPRRQPEVPEQTDSEGSESVHSGNESDRSDTSTRATVPSSNLRSPPPSSRLSPTSAVRGRSGWQGGRGGRTQATRPRGGGADDDDDDDDEDELEDGLYDLLESYDDEYQGPQRSRWDPNYQPGSHTSNGDQGRHTAGHQPKQPQLVKLPYSDFWVAVEHYEYYSKNPPPREHAPRPTTTQQARRNDHRSGRHDEPNVGSREHKKSSNKKHETEKQKNSHSRHEKYDSDSEYLSRRHGRRGASSPARTQKPKEKSKSSSKTKPSDSTRRPDRKKETESDTSSSESDSDSDPKPRNRRSGNHRTEKPTKEPLSTDHPRGQQPRQRSPRPYNRTGSRVNPKPRKETPYSHSETDSSSNSSSSDHDVDDDDDSDTPHRNNTRSSWKGKPRRPRSYTPPPTPRAVPERPKDYYAVLGLKPGATAAEYVFSPFFSHH